MLRRPVAFSVVAAIAAATLAAVVTAAEPPAPAPRVVEIVAHRFQFTPNVVTIRKDEPVLIRLRSEDVTHGFFQRPLGLNATIEPGKVTEIPLTPHEVGRYAVICHHFCGAGHGNMKMTFVVE
jgi:cytochrome c oxidase subunit 2